MSLPSKLTVNLIHNYSEQNKIKLHMHNIINIGMRRMSLRLILDVDRKLFHIRDLTLIFLKLGTIIINILSNYIDILRKTCT